MGLDGCSSEQKVYPALCDSVPIKWTHQNVKCHVFSLECCINMQVRLQPRSGWVGVFFVSISLCIETRSVRDMTHYSQAVGDIKVLVLSLMLKLVVLSVNLKHLFLCLTHILLQCHRVILAHSWPERSNSCLLWKTIFYSWIFHIEFLSRLNSSAAKCKHSWLFIENQPQHPAKPLLSLTNVRFSGIEEKLDFLLKSIHSSVTLPCVCVECAMHEFWCFEFAKLSHIEWLELWACTVRESRNFASVPKLDHW